jgi:hypothetical protein
MYVNGLTMADLQLVDGDTLFVSEWQAKTKFEDSIDDLSLQVPRCQANDLQAELPASSQQPVERRGGREGSSHQPVELARAGRLLVFAGSRSGSRNRWNHFPGGSPRTPPL